MGLPVSDEEGPPLGNRELRNLIILSELPFVVSFEERVKVSELKPQTGEVYLFPTYRCERQSLLSWVQVSELKPQTRQVYLFPTYWCERQCLLSWVKVS